MGGSSSKVARNAASVASRRQYPSTPSLGSSSQVQGPHPTTAPSTSSPKIPPPTNKQGPNVHPSPSSAPPSDSRNPQIDLDARDPDFGARLGALGPVRYNPQPVEAARNPGRYAPDPRVTPGSASAPAAPADASRNPALLIVRARERAGRAWEEENESLGRSSFAGRTQMNAGDITKILQMKDTGAENSRIEKQLRLKPGIVGSLGAGTIFRAL